MTKKAIRCGARRGSRQACGTQRRASKIARWMMGSYREGAAERAATIKTGCGIVVHEDVVETAIGKGSAAEPCDFPWMRYQCFSWVIWMRLPQVSFSMAILDAVTSVGGMVNSAPLAFMRS